jgi:hypothetical protein
LTNRLPRLGVQSRTWSAVFPSEPAVTWNQVFSAATSQRASLAG